MKIGQPFNQLTLKEYFYFIDNHKKYTDFNTLGLYRSIIENNKLTLAQKLELREYANVVFQKTFDFLQLKDPLTYIAVSTLGMELTQASEHQLWENIKKNQQKILSDKKIKHRNFGDYSKHNCGYETCPINGLMIKQGSYLSEGHMCFKSDKSKISGEIKSDKARKERKNQKLIIEKELEDSQGDESKY
jgi:hypothetical protein